MPGLEIGNIGVVVGMTRPVIDATGEIRTRLQMAGDMWIALRPPPIKREANYGAKDQSGGERMSRVQMVRGVGQIPVMVTTHFAVARQHPLDPSKCSLEIGEVLVLLGSHAYEL